MQTEPLEVNEKHERIKESHSELFIGLVGGDEDREGG